MQAVLDPRGGSRPGGQGFRLGGGVQGVEGGGQVREAQATAASVTATGPLRRASGGVAWLQGLVEAYWGQLQRPACTLHASTVADQYIKN